MIWRPPIAVVNARIGGADGASTLRFAARILAIDENPRFGDVVVDAQGAFVLPGFINAHDHLELNHYGRLKFRDRYRNVSEWIDDMRPRLAADEAIRRNRSYSLGDRLFIGALKNLLSGVTTVVHHNPFYRELRRMPLRVLREYGWAHSFGLERQPAGARGEDGGAVRARFRETPPLVPFFVHIAEGVDERARAELPRLDAEGCLSSNTVLVHGIAIDRQGWRDLVRAGSHVVWCPASNLFLFGETIDVAHAASAASAIVLGTDSRLTGARDLLEELRIAYESSTVAREDLLPMVTARAADAIRQPHLGRIAVGAPADLVVVPSVAREPGDALLATARRDLALVVVGGRAMVGSDAFGALFAARGPGKAQPIEIDGVCKLADPALTRQIGACAIAEPGVAA